MAALAAVCLLAAPVGAFIPKPERIAKAAADANRAGSRTQALSVDITLRVAGREPIATGELVTHPNGLARLELRDGQQRIERHLLVGTDHRAARQGEPIDEPRRFLPPLFLLQADSTLTLRSALADFGLDPEAVALAPCGARVCYVVGDPARVPPPFEPLLDPDALEEGEDAEGREVLVEESGSADEPIVLSLDTPVGDRAPKLDAEDEGDAAEGPRATLWLDAESFEPVRMTSRTGIVVEFGPVAGYGEVRFPRYVEIQEPERDPVRLDVVGVTPVNAPAADFGQAWMLAVPEPEGVPAPTPATVPPPSR